MGRVAKFGSPTNFFCSSIEPELWRYMLVTPRPNPSTIWRYASVGALGGVTLCFRNRSTYHSKASTASLELMTTLPSFRTWAPLPYKNSLAYRTAHVPPPRIPKPYWFFSGLVNPLASVRKSSQVQSAVGILSPYSFTRSVRTKMASFVRAQGNETILPLTVTVCQAVGVVAA